VVAERHTPVIDCVVTTDTLSFLYLVAGPAGGGKTHASHKFYIYIYIIEPKQAYPDLTVLCRFFDGISSVL
jgi:hypothetical protein